MTDIDLSILGREVKRFDEYEHQIRQEYAWVPELTFIEGRFAVLKKFLERESIYATDFFRQKYEAQARANMTRALRRLSSAAEQT